MYPKRFALWRVKVWDRKLKHRRAIWDSTIETQSRDHMHSESPAAVNTDAYWEAQVTKALAKRVKWRKRAGVRLRQGGPVTKGKPYIVGEHGPEVKP